MEAKTQLLVSAKDIAERLGVSLRHIRRMQCTGELPKPIHIGRLVRWSLADIEQWIAQGCPEITERTNYHE